MNKKECIKMLREEPEFNDVLQMSKDEDERRRIKAYAEDFVSKFYDKLITPIQESSKGDPEAFKRDLMQAIRELQKGKDESK